MIPVSGTLHMIIGTGCNKYSAWKDHSSVVKALSISGRNHCEFDFHESSEKKPAVFDLPMCSRIMGRSEEVPRDLVLDLNTGAVVKGSCFDLRVNTLWHRGQKSPQCERS